jgi:NDP-sugar pyrophosphorylase family protein
VAAPTLAGSAPRYDGAVNGMLLAAGRGDRMEPLSSLIAKPALEVLGHPLLASSLSHLRRAGCERIAVNLHRHPEQVAAAVRQASVGEVAFSWEPELLGGAGGVAAARAVLGAGPILVANADTWADLDLVRLVAAVEPDLAVLALLPHPDPNRWGSVILDHGGRVSGFLAPGAAHGGQRYLFTGFQVFGAEIVASLPAPPAEMDSVWHVLRRQGRLRGVVVAGSWREAGNPAAYRQLVVDLLGGETWAHARANVAEGAETSGSAVGAGCHVAKGATIHGSVLTAGAFVAGGCTVHRCVVAGPAVVGRGTRIADALIMPGGRFPLC